MVAAPDEFRAQRCDAGLVEVLEQPNIHCWHTGFAQDPVIGVIRRADDGYVDAGLAHANEAGNRGTVGAFRDAQCTYGHTAPLAGVGGVFENANSYLLAGDRECDVLVANPGPPDELLEGAKLMLLPPMEVVVLIK